MQTPSDSAERPSRMGGAGHCRFHVQGRNQRRAGAAELVNQSRRIVAGNELIPEIVSS